jgi:hypothetical protein
MDTWICKKKIMFHYFTIKKSSPGHPMCRRYQFKKKTKKLANVIIVSSAA